MVLRRIIRWILWQCLWIRPQSFINPAEGFGECCKLPQCFHGKAPATNAFFCISSSKTVSVVMFLVIAMQRFLVLPDVRGGSIDPIKPPLATGLHSHWSAQCSRIQLLLLTTFQSQNCPVDCRKNYCSCVHFQDLMKEMHDCLCAQLKQNL